MMVEIPYSPAPIWKEIHQGMETHQWSCVVGHRRFGKTVGTVNHMIKQAALVDKVDPQYAYIAPYRTQAKKIAWTYLKRYTAPIPGIKTNETELYVELPRAREGDTHGARLYIFGADKPDSFRGMYFDGVILDEFGDMKPQTWGEILRPALADRGGWAIFIGTPKGENAFYTVYQKSCASPDWFSAKYTIDDTNLPWLPDTEKEAMKQDMTEAEIRQELYCDFAASAFDVLIPIPLVEKGKRVRVHEADAKGSPMVFGLDPARFGDDDSILTKRRGLLCYPPIRFHGMDQMALADQMAMHIRRDSPDAVFIDSGLGAGVIDRLRQLRFSVIEVPFGAKARREERYVNKRSEMYDSIREWLGNGGSLPDTEELLTELSIPKYSFDARGRIKLEAKEHIKERIGRSPDYADSLALTFASPVSPRSKYGGNSSLMANTKYDFGF